MNFKIIKQSKSSKARVGIIETPHGIIKTPVFMPVGTLGTVKSLSSEDLLDINAQIILGNTYHLYLRPSCDVISLFNGLHGFMNWNKPILTDSGGFQIFSLAKLTKLSEDGAFFQSHIDGSKHFFSPEKIIEIQSCLNSDIMMPLDQCIKYPSEKIEAQKAVEMTSNWAKRSKDFWEKIKKDKKNYLFGIIQGSMFKDLREESLQTILNIGFDGYAIGGLSVGEPKEIMLEIADFVLPKLDDSKPKYVMGVGTPDDLINLVNLGADMFDCVLPTRNARNGQLFTSYGTLNISNARFKQDKEPVDLNCKCYTCKNYSKAYLRHLYMSRELLSYRLNTIHNVYFYINLINTLQEKILKD